MSIWKILFCFFFASRVVIARRSQVFQFCRIFIWVDFVSANGIFCFLCIVANFHKINIPTWGPHSEWKWTSNNNNDDESNRKIDKTPFSDRNRIYLPIFASSIECHRRYALPRMLRIC